MHVESVGWARAEAIIRAEADVRPVVGKLVTGRTSSQIPLKSTLI